MATIKFSGFTNEAVDAADTQLVGYKVGDATANYRYSIAQLATALSPSISNFYTADGTIGTTRKALITDTIQFRNAGDANDIFTLNTTGVFTLGLDAATHGTTSVAVGNNSTATAQYSTIVGNYARVNNSAYSYSTVVGYNSSTAGGQAIVLGANSGAAENSITIGYSSNSASANSINIGKDSEGNATNSITFNVSGGIAAPTTVNAFGVYMSSNTTPDLEVIGGAGAESTLNSSLKITGQGYTELHANATNLVVSWNDSNIQTVTVNSSSPTFAPTDPKAGATYILIIEQGATPVTVDWNSLVKWPAGSPPTLSSVTGKIDVITLICYDDSTTNGLYYGSATLDLA